LRTTGRVGPAPGLSLKAPKKADTMKLAGHYIRVSPGDSAEIRAAFAQAPSSARRRQTPHYR
jgi:hypothetical protein